MEWIYITVIFLIAALMTYGIFSNVDYDRKSDD